MSRYGQCVALSVMDTVLDFLSHVTVSNSFFSPSAHLCAVTCITEISLIVTLNNQSHLLDHTLATWTTKPSTRP